MTTTTCPHDDDPNSCPPCRNSLEQMDNFLEHGPTRYARTFIAEYQGHCTGCEDRIEIGQKARYSQGGILVHVDCY